MVWRFTLGLTLGNIGAALIETDTCDAATRRLEKAIQEFDSALSFFGHSIGFRTFQTVEGIRYCVIAIVDIKIYVALKSFFDHTLTADSSIEDNFMVPYEENATFVGRTKLLRSLHEMLVEVVPNQNNHRVALHGMGGVGKTQTALAYVYAHRVMYEWAFWVNADNEASLQSGFVGIAMRIGLAAFVKTLEPRQLAERVLLWLRQHDHWLVVFDNLDTIEIIKNLLPVSTQSKHTLITTRNPNAKGIPARGLEVALPEVDEAIEMLYTLSEMATDFQTDKAAQIVKELDCLPLAIEQAASYVREVTRNFETFLTDYGKRRAELHKWVPGGNRQYTRSVASTWSVSFEFVKSQQPIAARFFQFLSFLNPDIIMLDFIQAGKQGLGQDLQELIGDSLAIAKALLALERFSLLKWSRETNILSIHRLVQAVVRDELNPDGCVRCMSEIVELCWRAFPAKKIYEHMEIGRQYHSQIVGPLLSVTSLRTDRAADVLHDIGYALASDGTDGDGEKLVLKAAEICSEVLGAENRKTLSWLQDLAWCYYLHGKLNMAVELAEDNLVACIRALGETDETTITQIRRLAWIKLDLGQSDEATRMAEKSLQLSRYSLGEEHEGTVNAMRCLAYSYSSQGKLKEAAGLEERALAMHIKSHGEKDNHLTLHIMHDLAQMYMVDGRLAEAAELQEEVLASRTSLLGNDHRDTLLTMTNLATTYDRLRKHAEAEKLKVRVLEASSRTLGKEHPLTLCAMHNLAVSYHHTGRLADAINLLEKVVEAQHRRLGTLGDYHPDTVSSACVLGKMYYDNGQLDEALNLWERNLMRSEQSHTSRSGILACIVPFAQLLSQKGRKGDAIELLQSNLRDLKVFLGEQNKLTLEGLQLLEDLAPNQIASGSSVNEQSENKLHEQTDEMK